MNALRDDARPRGTDNMFRCTGAIIPIARFAMVRVVSGTKISLVEPTA